MDVAEGDPLSSALWELTLPRLKTDLPVWCDLSNIENAPTLPRAGHALVSAGATLLLMGGETGSAASESLVYALDTLTTPQPTWRALTSTPGAVATHQVVGVVNNIVAMYGGSDKGAVHDKGLRIVDVRQSPLVYVLSIHKVSCIFAHLSALHLSGTFSQHEILVP